MRKLSIIRNVFVLLLLGLSLGAQAQPNSMFAMGGGNTDPPGNFLPGKYFEYKAQFYLKKKDYREALRLFELAGFWANKVAQYNAGLMYYKGIGVPVDRARGTAWLGIAAEASGDLAMTSLQAAYASLSENEKRDAGDIFADLEAKYGDDVAIPRALGVFNEQAKAVTGSRVGFSGNVLVYETGQGAAGENGAEYLRRQTYSRNAMIERITGRVTVGDVQTLKVPEGAAKEAFPQPKQE